MQITAQILLYVGLFGAAEFAALAFASRQLSTASVSPRLRRKMDSPLVRNANLVITVCAVASMVGLAGLVLHG